MAFSRCSMQMFAGLGNAHPATEACLTGGQGLKLHLRMP